MNQKGFTIAELMIATVLLITVTLIISNFLFTVFKNAVRAEIAKEVRQSGSYALTVIEDRIRDSSAILSPVCPSGGASAASLNLAYEDKTVVYEAKNAGGYMRLWEEIRDASGGFVEENYLTSGNTHLASLNFTCATSDGVEKVDLAFTLSSKPSAIRREEQSSMAFASTIYARNN